MNDSQVQGEMRKMTAFIRQEALEKSKEIHIKADEEFAIEKAKLVRTEQSKIDESFEGRTKKASMSQQIAKSTVLNKQRLKILAARQEVLDDIFEEARNQLSSIAKDQGKYSKLVEQLLLQVRHSSGSYLAAFIDETGIPQTHVKRGYNFCSRV